jgi:MoaA/NifB/PqqE/SkfB family radical SAM enzyme
MNLKEEIKGWLGTHVHGYSFNIDIANICPLSCPSCANSFYGHRKPHYMDLELFKLILNKMKSETKVRKLQMYGYSDPCIHPNLDDFIFESNRRDIPVVLSTMLQTTHCDFKKVIEARPAEFRVSFPGYKHMSYYQHPAKPEVFKRKLEEVCRLPRHKETTWILLFQLYRDNQDEIDLANELACKYDLKPVILPAIFMSTEKMVDKDYTPADLELIGRLIETPEETIQSMNVCTDYCLCWKQITIDALGELYLCQLVFKDEFKMGKFLDIPHWKIVKMMKEHPFCQKCMAVGGHTYQYCFADFIKFKDPMDAIAAANKRRKKRV